MKTTLLSSFAMSNHLNKSSLDTTNDQIAQFLYEHRNEIQNKTLSEIVKESYFSQASFTRFFQSNKVRSFQEFKLAFYKHEGEFKQYCSTFIRHIKRIPEDQIISKIISSQIDNIKAVADIPKEELDKVLDCIHSHKRIIFIGSDLSMSLMTVFQHILMYDDKNCYLLSDYSGQENMTSRLSKEDLVIVISIKQRWYSSEMTGNTILNILSSDAYKMLWTLEDNHKDKDSFDYLFQFGRHINELGYTQLSTLSPILANLYCKKYLEHALIL